MFKPPLERNCEGNGRLRARNPSWQSDIMPAAQTDRQPKSKKHLRVQLEEKKSKGLPSHHAPTLTPPHPQFISSMFNAHGMTTPPQI
jgi:hypothetical protein